MGLFGGKKEEQFEGMIGVDIGPSGIKITELIAEKGRVRLSTYGYTEMAEAKPDAASLIDLPDKAAELIRATMKDSGMKATRAVAALPSALVFQTIVTIPQVKTKEELKAMIETQAGKVLPLPIAEMIVDSNVLDKDLLPKELTGDKKETPQEKKEQKKEAEEKKDEVAEPSVDAKKHIRVLVTAAPRALVQKYIDIFRKAKLELVSLETEVFALIRSLVGKDKSRIMIVDMGFLQTNIAIIDKGIPYLSRSMKGGGAGITQALATSLGTSYDDAERMKRDLSLANSQAEPPKVIKDALQGVVHELRYSLELYAQQAFHDNRTVEKIIITGGSAHLPSLDPYLTKELNVNVYIGDPWARVAAPPALRPVLEEIGPRFSIALGLAMRASED